MSNCLQNLALSKINLVLLLAVLAGLFPFATLSAASTNTEIEISLPWVIQDNQFMDNSLSGHSSPVWLAGINYEGYTDRGWKMWEDKFFDPSLIDEDFRVARAGGFNTVRIFIQAPLALEIQAKNFRKLDKVIEIARVNRLKLLVTLADYGEPVLTKLLEVDRLIAAHLRGNPVILGYDLKNEPFLGDFAGIVYPLTSGTGQVAVALQTDEKLIRTYGEKMNPAEVERWRLTPEGGRVISGLLEAHRAYLVANAYQYWKEYKQAAVLWANQALQASSAGPDPSEKYWQSIMDPNSYTKKGRVSNLLKVSQLGPGKEAADGQQPGFSPPVALDFSSASSPQPKWNLLLEDLNSTLSTWITLRRDALRGGDSNALITIGYNDLHLAALPSNKALSFIAPHIYGGPSAIASLMVNLLRLRNNFPDKPVVLAEFGSSDVQWPDVNVPEEVSSSYEAVVWLWLWQNHFAGGYRWQLNNTTNIDDRIEATFGILNDQHQAKQIFNSGRSVLQMVKNCQGGETLFQGLDKQDSGGYNLAGLCGPSGSFSRLELGLDGNTLTYNWNSLNGTQNNNYWSNTFSNEPTNKIADPKEKKFKNQLNYNLTEVGPATWSVSWRFSPTTGKTVSSLNSTPSLAGTTSRTILVNIQTSSTSRITLDLNNLWESIAKPDQNGGSPVNRVEIKQVSSQWNPLSSQVTQLPVSNFLAISSNNDTRIFSLNAVAGSNYLIEAIYYFTP